VGSWRIELRLGGEGTFARCSWKCPYSVFNIGFRTKNGFQHWLSTLEGFHLISVYDGRCIPVEFTAFDC